ncbi:hypothetical protein E2L08_08860 [Palleronia sediminis]|uniref:Uncharacterized protein n=1 Tax=Palleronia sediminis TaxID=2547833 RepID=A0A4R6AAE3_9RHOB|nr:hypothetical protein E2L08_08860 [Palleronia sediminis]
MRKLGLIPGGSAAMARGDASGGTVPVIVPPVGGAGVGAGWGAGSGSSGSGEVTGGGGAGGRIAPPWGTTGIAAVSTQADSNRPVTGSIIVNRKVIGPPKSLGGHSPGPNAIRPDGAVKTPRPRPRAVRPRRHTRKKMQGIRDIHTSLTGRA